MYSYIALFTLCMNNSKFILSTEVKAEKLRKYMCKEVDIEKDKGPRPSTLWVVLSQNLIGTVQSQSLYGRPETF